MLEIGFIFFCERCGGKRCCCMGDYERTCVYCHLRGVLCQAEISYEVVIIEGECEDCAQNFAEGVINEIASEASNLPV